MRAGLRRLIAAWSLFGILVAADAATLAITRKGGALDGQLGRAALGALVWGLLESFCGPWAKGRQERMDTRKAADVMAGAVGESLRAENDKDGQRVRRCS